MRTITVSGNKKSIEIQQPSIFMTMFWWLALGWMIGAGIVSVIEYGWQMAGDSFLLIAFTIDKIIQTKKTHDLFDFFTQLEEEDSNDRKDN